MIKEKSKKLLCNYDKTMKINWLDDIATVATLDHAFFFLYTKERYHNCISTSSSSYGGVEVAISMSRTEET